MNILILAHRLPYPPDKGEKIRSFHLLRYLSRRHAVWCACLIDDPSDWKYVPELRSLCRELAVFPVRRMLGLIRGLGRLVIGGTITEGYFTSRPLAAAITEWSTRVRFDAVLAFSSGTARYVLEASAPRRVLDLCDIDSAKWRALAERSRWPVRGVLRAEAKRLARREWELASAFDVTTVISDREAEMFKQIAAAQGPGPAGPQPEVVVLSNGVDLEAFRPFENAPCGPVVGFVGTMNYAPNVDGVCWFVEEAWPRIRRQHPQARFLIVGRSPVRRVRQLAHSPGVEVTGSVPDVREYLKIIRVCVAPIRIVHGLQNKVLEAMACAKPVVTTGKVAGAIDAQPGREIMVADEACAFAEQTATLLGDEGRCEEVGQAARRFVETRFRWEDRARTMEDLISCD